MPGEKEKKSGHVDKFPHEVVIGEKRPQRKRRTVRVRWEREREKRRGESVKVNDPRATKLPGVGRD